MLPWFCKTTLFTAGSVDTMMGVPRMCVLNTFPYLQTYTQTQILTHSLFGGFHWLKKEGTCMKWNDKKIVISVQSWKLYGDIGCACWLEEAIGHIGASVFYGHRHEGRLQISKNVDSSRKPLLLNLRQSACLSMASRPWKTCRHCELRLAWR